MKFEDCKVGMRVKAIKKSIYHESWIKFINEHPNCEFEIYLVNNSNTPYHVLARSKTNFHYCFLPEDLVPVEEKRMYICDHADICTKYTCPSKKIGSYNEHNGYFKTSPKGWDCKHVSTFVKAKFIDEEEKKMIKESRLFICDHADSCRVESGCSSRDINDYNNHVGYFRQYPNGWSCQQAGPNGGIVKAKFIEGLFICDHASSCEFTGNCVCKTPRSFSLYEGKFRKNPEGWLCHAYSLFGTLVKAKFIDEEEKKMEQYKSLKPITVESLRNHGACSDVLKDFIKKAVQQEINYAYREIPIPVAQVLAADLGYPNWLEEHGFIAKVIQRRKWKQGDRVHFKTDRLDRSYSMILATVDLNQVVAIVIDSDVKEDIGIGNRWTAPVDVKDRFNLSDDELDKISGTAIEFKKALGLKV